MLPEYAKKINKLLPNYHNQFEDMDEDFQGPMKGHLKSPNQPHCPRKAK